MNDHALSGIVSTLGSALARLDRLEGHIGDPDEQNAHRTLELVRELRADLEGARTRASALSGGPGRDRRSGEQLMKCPRCTLRSLRMIGQQTGPEGMETISYRCSSCGHESRV